MEVRRRNAPVHRRAHEKHESEENGVAEDAGGGDAERVLHEPQIGVPLPASSLTGICLHEYIRDMESAFGIIAEPNRRAILGLLATSERSVTDIEQHLRMPQPSVSKHLRVLRDAGFVEARVDAQRRVYRIRPEPLMEIDAWLVPFRRFWSAHIDALERHLDRIDQAPPRKRKKR